MNARISLSGRTLALLLALVAPLAIAADSVTRALGPAYAFATDGVTAHMSGGGGSEWKLLLDQSNLGGRELEMVEVTLAPGTAVPSHTHGSLEVIYVLSGTYEHEVNGKRYALTPGMVGIVRPGDHVRHLVPQSGPAKLLILWAPGGEAARVVGRLKGTAVPGVAEINAGAGTP